MTTEDDALDRLLAAGARIDAPSTPYGTGPDHVHETYGPVAARTLVVVHGGYFRLGAEFAKLITGTGNPTMMVMMGRPNFSASFMRRRALR